MKNFIAECAEVDFMRAEQIEEIGREAIERHLNADVLERTRADGARDKAKLKPIAELWDDLGTDLNP